MEILLNKSIQDNFNRGRIQLIYFDMYSLNFIFVNIIDF